MAAGKSSSESSPESASSHTEAKDVLATLRSLKLSAVRSSPSMSAAVAAGAAGSGGLGASSSSTSALGEEAGAASAAPVARCEVCVHADANPRYREAMEDTYSLCEFKVYGGRGAGGAGGARAAAGTGRSGPSTPGGPAEEYSRIVVAGVYDGHGGDAAAKFVAKKLPQELQRRMVEEGAGVSAELFDGAFAAIDRRLQRDVDHKDSGSTAVVALLERRHGKAATLWVANAGDSHAWLYNVGRDPVRMSTEHKATIRAEVRRVEARGGFVTQGRVCGSLAVTRAFGNFELGAVTRPEPDVTKVELHGRPTDFADRFLILASDGLWDVVSPELAGEVVRKTVHGRLGHSKAAEALVFKSIELGTADNVTAIVAFF
jgi:serine/threonine protein phosphatase PrpC